MKYIIDTNGNEFGHPMSVKDVPNIDEICEWFCVNQLYNGVKMNYVEKDINELRRLLKNID